MRGEGGCAFLIVLIVVECVSEVRESLVSVVLLEWILRFCPEKLLWRLLSKWRKRVLGAW